MNTENDDAEDEEIDPDEDDADGQDDSFDFGGTHTFPFLDKMFSGNDNTETPREESGTRPIDFDYNEKARILARKYGALFIFDEVVTGFRVGVHGAAGYFFGDKYKVDDTPVFIDGKPWIVQDISFSISEGQKVGLVAKNGTGKSTLLSILCGRESR